jgi:hypothetical protein
LGIEFVVSLELALLGAALLLLAGVTLGRGLEQRQRRRQARRLADLEREFTRATYRHSRHGAGRAAAAAHYREDEPADKGAGTGEQSPPR